MDRNYVSIVMPTFERAHIITKAIDSILAQTYSDFELLVIDDASSDNTEDIVNSFQDPRIRYIKCKHNIGANAARNKGVEESNYSIIAFHDSDDIWHPQKLDLQVDFLKNNNVEVVASQFNYFVKDKLKCIIPPKEKAKGQYLSDILHCNFVSTQTLMGYKSCFVAQPFDANLPRFQDWELAIRLLTNYKFGFVNEPLVDVYVQSDSISQSRDKGQRALGLILEKHFELFSIDNSILSNFYFTLSRFCDDKESNKKFLKMSLTAKFKYKSLVLLIYNLLNFR
ncbi:glycosyltransferase family 2 protein [Vibrio artabrorum]|uniref:glycosyltransferase family 2 protein n=1 Tax=Vibrio artabrorum TaxID=446374 RepID=UPI0035535064